MASEANKQTEHDKELAKWTELFTGTTPEIQKAAEGLIKKAAYIHSLCWELEDVINKSGAIKIHPDNPTMQKEVPAVKEYARLAESYANMVNKLNGLRSRNLSDSEDNDLDDFK